MSRLVHAYGEQQVYEGLTYPPDMYYDFTIYPLI